MHIHQYGAELEKPFAYVADGSPFAVTDSYFQRLHELKTAVGTAPELVHAGDRTVAVLDSLGTEGLESSFVLGESSLNPVASNQGGLQGLYERITTSQSQVVSVLAEQGGGILNMSNNPLIKRNKQNIEAFGIPKPNSIARNVRNWRFGATINACAQNSPSTSVEVYKAAEAANVIIGLGSAFIALYANSPFNEGRPTSWQENRMDLWPTYFADATLPADRKLHYPPPVPFNNLRDYFQWMFRSETSVFSMKYTVAGNPSLLEFFEMEEWDAEAYPGGESLRIKPTMGHLATHQLMQFSGARVRFGLAEGLAESGVDDFLGAMAGRHDEVEAYMDSVIDYMYIEARDPGANFPDRALAEEDSTAARSMLISPAALQAGLLNNIAEASALLEQYDWSTLMDARKGAAISGLDATVGNHTVRDVCRQIIEVAGRGIATDEQWMLAYPQYVVETGKNGAVRARSLYEQSNGSTPLERIGSAVKSRIAVLPSLL